MEREGSSPAGWVELEAALSLLDAATLSYETVNESS